MNYSEYYDATIEAFANFRMPEFRVSDREMYVICAAFGYGEFPNAAAFLAHFAEPVRVRSGGAIRIIVNPKPLVLNKGPSLYFKLVQGKKELPFIVGSFPPAIWP